MDLPECDSRVPQPWVVRLQNEHLCKNRGEGVLLLTVSAQCRCRGRASARLAKRSKRSSPSPAFHPVQVDLRSLCSHELTSCPSISSICIPCVFIHLQIAFFATRLFSKTSALPPSFSKSGQNPLPTTHYTTHCFFSCYRESHHMSATRPTLHR